MSSARQRQLTPSLADDVHFIAFQRLPPTIRSVDCASLLRPGRDEAYLLCGTWRRPSRGTPGGSRGRSPSTEPAKSADTCRCCRSAATSTSMPRAVHRGVVWRPRRPTPMPLRLPSACDAPSLACEFHSSRSAAGVGRLTAEVSGFLTDLLSQTAAAPLAGHHGSSAARRLLPVRCFSRSSILPRLSWRS